MKKGKRTNQNVKVISQQALTIKIPENFIPERSYIIDVLFNEFLGLEYKIETEQDISGYKIILPDGNQLIIEDHFFSKYKDDSSYLNRKYIPSKIEFVKNEYTSEADIPIIYGTSELTYKDQQPKEIICGIDVFASSFFMLTRWEEYVITEKDEFGRFPEHLGLSQIHNFHLRPVVNEYCELLWNLLKALGFKGDRKINKYSIILTHDVDQIARYDSIFKYIKAIGGDIIKRKNLKLPFLTTRDYIKVKFNLQKDNYDTFDYLMNLSESFNLKSHFYFIPALEGEKDFRYSIFSSKVREIIENINDRGHIVGIHGSYRSYNDPEIFNTEILRLKKIHNDIMEGRQHYLRFENPLTWQIWEDNKLMTDSTMSFYSDGGFRCGTCYEYSVFNILTRKKLKLKESPLIAMEGALREKNKEPDKIYDAAVHLAEVVKKYNGNFVFLWHNNNFFHYDWAKYTHVYKKILEKITF